MGQLFFDEECIYEILKRVMDGRTDGKAQSNMPLNFFKVGGIKTAQMVLSGELRASRALDMKCLLMTSEPQVQIQNNFTELSLKCPLPKLHKWFITNGSLPELPMRNDY